jgi:hypothetical protein
MSKKSIFQRAWVRVYPEVPPKRLLLQLSFHVYRCRPDEALWVVSPLLCLYLTVAQSLYGFNLLNAVEDSLPGRR